MYVYYLNYYICVCVFLSCMIWRTLGLPGTACLAAHRLMRCVTHKNPRSAAGSTVCVWVVSQRRGVSAYPALRDHRATLPPSQLPSSHRYCYMCNFFSLSETANRFSQPLLWEVIYCLRFVKQLIYKHHLLKALLSFSWLHYFVYGMLINLLYVVQYNINPTIDSIQNNQSYC